MAYPVALFLVLALSSTTLPSPALAGGIGEAYNFCSRLSEQTSSCIKPTTEDAVDLGLAAGRWYLAAANAQFAFLPLTLLGSQCATVNYTSVGRQFLRRAIGIVNNNVRLLDDSQMAQVGAISEASQSIGLGIRQMCNYIKGGFISITGLNKVTMMISGGSNEDSLQQGSQIVRRNILSASARAFTIYEVLEEIQQLNNVLNGFSAPDPIDVESLKERLMNLTQEVDFFLKLIDNQRLNVKQGAADISAYTWNPLTKGLAAAIQLLASGFGPWNTARLRMVDANEALKNVISSLGAEVTGLDGIVLDNSTSTAPRNTVSEVNKLFTGRKGLLPFSPKSALKKITLAPGKVVTQLSGKVVQNLFNPGRFTLRLGDLTGEYSVIKIANSTSSVLVYLCTVDGSTGQRPLNNLLVLTRDPQDINSALIEQAKTLASQLGIYIGGDNPLVAISQDPAVCSILDPLK